AKTTLDEWIYFLKNDRIKEDFKAQGLPKAREILDYLRLSAEDRAAYDYEQEAKSRYLSQIASAKYEAEWEYSKQLKEKDKALEEKDKALEEQRKAREEQRKALEEKDKALEEKDKTLEEKDKALEEQSKALEEQAREIEKYKRLLNIK
ncbi:MAG: hypothetical protein LBF89_01500, partial [Bacteroidales bacterium]|nr:hypothetical protein [Bacteroidales bacterium]